MDECKRMGVPVLGPDVNESEYQFAVNKKGQIRFGLGAVKGVGEAAVQSIVEERKANGPYQDIFDLVRRINLRAANKKTFESLAYAGGFDSLGIQRSTFFYTEGNDNISFLERIIRYGNGHQDGANSAQVSLFGEESAVDMPVPNTPVCEPWGNIEQLKYEKDVVGFYISGHPLDTYKLEIDNFCFHAVADIKKTEEFRNKDLVFGGVVTNVHNGITKTGNPWGKITIEDYNESAELAFFGEDYVKFKQYMVNGLFLFVKGKIQERFRNSGNWEFKVQNIQLLSELREKLARNITINVPLRSLNQEFISAFNGIIAENAKVQPQNCQLRFKVIDSEENIAVELPSKRIKVNPTNEFIEMLDEYGLSFKLN